MMKKLLVTLIIVISMFSLTGCGDKILNVNIDNPDKLNNNIIGLDALTEIGNGLYYDSTTRIVYWWGGVLYSSYGTAPSPYYAPNGLPYRYNPETCTFEEIQI